MVYAYDKIAQMPTRDLYDTQLMAMAINAAKDQYDKAEKRLDDLENQLGDFYSPHAKDMQWYKTNVEDRIKNALDDLYSKGIDPLRSAEGRAALRLLERSVPKSIVTKMKANAALYEKRRELVDALKAEGKYSLDFDDFMREQNGLGKVEDFSTVGPNGVLNTFEGTPYKYSDASTLYTPYVKDLEKAVLTEQQMREQYPDVPYDPMNDYKARTPEAVKNALKEAMPGLAGNPNYEYQRDLARRDLITQNALMGGNPNYVPTEQEINKRTEDMAYGSVSRFVTQPEAHPNEIRKMKYQYDLMGRNARRTSSGAGGGSGNGGSGSKDKPTYSFLGDSYRSMKQAMEDKSVSLPQYQNEVVKSLGKKATPQAVVNKLKILTDSQAVFGRGLDRNQTTDKAGTFYSPYADNSRLKTDGEIVADMLNMSLPYNPSEGANKIRHDLRLATTRGYTDEYDNPSGIMYPTGYSVFYTDKNGITHHYIEVDVTYASLQNTGSGTNAKRKSVTKRMYYDTGAKYDANGDMQGDWSFASAFDVRAGLGVANKTDHVTGIGDNY